MNIDYRAPFDQGFTQPPYFRHNFKHIWRIVWRIYTTEMKNLKCKSRPSESVWCKRITKLSWLISYSSSTTPPMSSCFFSFPSKNNYTFGRWPLWVCRNNRRFFRLKLRCIFIWNLMSFSIFSLLRVIPKSASNDRGNNFPSFGWICVDAKQKTWR